MGMQMVMQSPTDRARDVAQNAMQALLKSQTATAQLGGHAAVAQAVAGGSLNGMQMKSNPSRDELIVVAQGLDPKRLFVGQLARGISNKETLSGIFEPFGQVESIRLLEEKGVAYVQYTDFESANAALLALNGKHFPGISREQGLNLTFSKRR